MPEIYLDNSATTKPCPEAAAKALEIATVNYGNPSSAHAPGRAARAALDEARALVAGALGAAAPEITFTSGGTEANNLAVFGACSLAVARGRGRKIVTTAVEHPSVTKAVRFWKRRGWQVAYIPAPGGRLDLAALEEAIDQRTALVTLMLINNEIGSLFPVREARRFIEAVRAPALLHTDAVQAFGRIRFTPAELGVDLATVSAHKIHGLKGAGALYMRRGRQMHALHFGGGQENGLRPGTEALPAVAAFGEAARLASARLETAAAHMAALRDHCLRLLTARLPAAGINSGRTGAPHIVNFSLPGIPSAETVRYLSEKGIYVSDGAACKSNHPGKGPQVLESFGLSPEEMYSAIRVSFCAENTTGEVEALVGALEEFTMGERARD
ncbi:MAG: cysteine desulfurase [Gracilibacteraceae bacterium]|jgi:cysteine desulfurase|nr:cysteine desulfurase [Gracilibacteraceae bacterium]